MLAVVALAVLRGPMTTQRFSIDESRWISTSRYFWITLVDRDVFGSAWQPNYLIMTQPPVARYLIGFGLWFQGWAPDELNGRYDSLEPYSWNFARGNVPSQELLRAARRVLLVFAVGAVLLLYLVGRTLGGPAAGIVAAALALANPLLSTLWTRALAESVLAFFTLLALLLALRSLPRTRDDGRSDSRPLFAGVALGLAAATKLSGGLGAVGLAIFGALQQAFALVRTRRPLEVKHWFHLGSAAVIVFVVVNPLLYPDPFGRARALYEHRRDEMLQQQATWPNQAVPANLATRAATIARRTFGEYVVVRGFGPLSPDAVLVAAGMVVALVGAWREMWRVRTPGMWTLFVCWIVATYAIITANLGFDSTHYYAPLVTLNTILSGVAVSVAVRWFGARAQMVQAPFRKSGSRTSQTTAMTPMPTSASGPLAPRSSSAIVETEPTG